MGRLPSPASPHGVPYAWQCFACEASNPAGTNSCTTCGFPARASGQDIDAARRARSQGIKPPTVAGIRDTFASESIAQLLAPLLWRRQVLAVAGCSLLAAGWLGFKIAFSIAGFAWSIGLVIAGFGVTVIAFAERAGQPSA